MAEHNITGIEGEKLAVKWLQRNGFNILHTNWRYSHYEIDIIASKKNVLHFIEVKCRKSHYYGYPEKAVGKTKFKNVQKAADQFLALNPGYKWIQFDILAISIRYGRPSVFMVEDVTMH